jgi:hypothetical protein
MVPFSIHNMNHNKEAAHLSIATDIVEVAKLIGLLILAGRREHDE